MCQHNMFGNCQSQPSSARFAGAGLVHSIETFEQASQVLGRNARAEILNVEFDSSRDGSRSQNDTATRSGIFQRIIHKIREDLMDGLGISSNLSSVGCVLYL